MTILADQITELTAFAHRALESVPGRNEAERLATYPTEALLAAAQEITRTHASRTFNLCGIVNAKSGRCSEDCAWCAQSRCFETGIQIYPLIDREKTLAAAKAAQANGITRFSLVTSGRKLSAREVRETADLVRAIREQTDLQVCLSAGLLKESELRTLFEAGVVRCHCNLESSPEYFSKLCTTHTIVDKIRTIQSARAVGMDVCSGGIIGMGEAEPDRIHLALTLRELNIGSIPINILSPIKGTALADQTLLSDEEILRAVALFRLINPTAQLRFAGGRARLSPDVQKRALEVGINAAIAGDMLTTKGSAVASDKVLIREAGYDTNSVADFDAAHLWHPYASATLPPPVNVAAGGHGARIVLADGRELIDGTSSWWCAAFGYNRPEIVHAIQKQAETLSHVMFAGFTHDPAVELGKRLVKLLPEGLAKIFYADSGSVAVEIALKLAVQYQIAQGRPSRTNFVTIRKGYHGDTWNAMSVCDPVAGMHGLFAGSLQPRIFIDEPKSVFGGSWDPSDVDELKKVLDDRESEIAALILEPIVQGASAMRFYHPQFLKEAKRLAEARGILLIADEIATGFGRTGKRFACDWAGIRPDIMTLGKALTGGALTLSAVCTTNAVADAVSCHAPYALMHGPTFMANPIACAAAAAALDVYMSQDWEARVHAIECKLQAGLESMRGMPGVRDVRVCGAIGVVEVERSADNRVLAPAFVREGVWVRPFGNVFYLMPPFVISDDELDRLLTAFRKVTTAWIRNKL